MGKVVREWTLQIFRRIEEVSRPAICSFGGRLMQTVN